MTIDLVLWIALTGVGATVAIWAAVPPVVAFFEKLDRARERRRGGAR